MVLHAIYNCAQLSIRFLIFPFLFKIIRTSTAEPNTTLHKVVYELKGRAKKNIRRKGGSYQLILDNMSKTRDNEN